jgi:hypothetical protein
MLLGSQGALAFQGGKLFLMGDGSVRFIGVSLSQVIADVTANSRLGSIGQVVLGPADAFGWKATPQPNGIIAILIGLLLPAVQKVQGSPPQQALLLPAVQKVREAAARVSSTRGGKSGMAATPARQGVALGKAEQHALALLRPCLTAGAKLGLLGIHPGGVNAEELGFTGGVNVLG